jgi:hypothetical protein
MDLVSYIRASERKRLYNNMFNLNKNNGWLAVIYRENDTYDDDIVRMLLLVVELRVSCAHE